MSARLTTKLWVSALVRRANDAGDFATIVRKGEETAGQVILLVRRRGGDIQLLTRAMNAAGRYSWAVTIECSQDQSAKIDEYLERQTRYDPDLWVVELDTGNPERFIDDELI